MRRLRGHRSWADLPAVSELEALELRGHQQVNDAYLLLLARRHRGVLATFDGRIASWAGAGKDVSVISQ
jgi:predicted nucleic acid-binding protein